MIITLLLTAIGTMLSAMFSWLPIATVASIPYIGNTLSSVLINAVQSWNSFVVTFPYAGISWHVLIWVVIPFEITMLILKTFLGSRTPSHTN